jgi:hypothetical protein
MGAGATTGARQHYQKGQVGMAGVHRQMRRFGMAGPMIPRLIRWLHARRARRQCARENEPGNVGRRSEAPTYSEIEPDGKDD